MCSVLSFFCLKLFQIWKCCRPQQMSDSNQITNFTPHVRTNFPVTFWYTYYDVNIFLHCVYSIVVVTRLCLNRIQSSIRFPFPSAWVHSELLGNVRRQLRLFIQGWISHTGYWSSKNTWLFLYSKLLCSMCQYFLEHFFHPLMGTGSLLLYRVSKFIFLWFD